MLRLRQRKEPSQGSHRSDKYPGFFPTTALFMDSFHEASQYSAALRDSQEAAHRLHTRCEGPTGWHRQPAVLEASWRGVQTGRNATI